MSVNRKKIWNTVVVIFAVIMLFVVIGVVQGWIAQMNPVIRNAG